MRTAKLERSRHRLEDGNSDRGANSRCGSPDIARPELPRARKDARRQHRQNQRPRDNRRDCRYRDCQWPCAEGIGELSKKRTPWAIGSKRLQMDQADTSCLSEIVLSSFNWRQDNVLTEGVLWTRFSRAPGGLSPSRTVSFPASSPNWSASLLQFRTRFRQVHSV